MLKLYEQWLCVIDLLDNAMNEEKAIIFVGSKSAVSIYANQFRMKFQYLIQDLSFVLND